MIAKTELDVESTNISISTFAIPFWKASDVIITRDISKDKWLNTSDFDPNPLKIQEIKVTMAFFSYFVD